MVREGGSESMFKHTHTHGHHRWRGFFEWSKTEFIHLHWTSLPRHGNRMRCEWLQIGRSVCVCSCGTEPAHTRTQRTYNSSSYDRGVPGDTALSASRLISLHAQVITSQSRGIWASWCRQHSAQLRPSGRGLWREDNALLKYDTLPWDHTPLPYIPLSIYIYYMHMCLAPSVNWCPPHTLDSQGKHWDFTRDTDEWFQESKLQVLCQQCHLYCVFHA